MLARYSSQVSGKSMTQQLPLRSQDTSASRASSSPIKQRHRIVAFVDRLQLDPVPLVVVDGEVVGNRRGDGGDVVRPADEREVIGANFAVAERPQHVAVERRVFDVPRRDADQRALAALVLVVDRQHVQLAVFRVAVVLPPGGEPIPGPHRIAGGQDVPGRFERGEVGARGDQMGREHGGLSTSGVNVWRSLERGTAARESYATVSHRVAKASEKSGTDRVMAIVRFAASGTLLLGSNMSRHETLVFATSDGADAGRLADRRKADDR